MKQQTAVECFWNKIALKLSVEQVNEFLPEFEQAKEMEKEKIIDAIIFSEREHYIMGECWPIQTVVDKAESYYNETFKND